MKEVKLATESLTAKDLRQILGRTNIKQLIFTQGTTKIIIFGYNAKGVGVSLHGKKESNEHI